jgi:hypothetical protein
MSGRGAAGTSAGGEGAFPATGGQGTGGISGSTGGTSGSTGGLLAGGGGAGYGGVSAGVGGIAASGGRSGAPMGGVFPCDAIDCVDGRIVYVPCPGGSTFTNCNFAATGVECVKEGPCPGSGEGGEGGRG